jgi:hypothetical protein
VYFHFVQPDGPLSAFDEGIVRNHRVGNGVYKPFDATRAPPEFTCVGVLDGEEKLFLARAAGWFEPGSYERRAIGKSGYAVYARR